MTKKLSVLFLTIIIAFAAILSNLNYAIFAANSEDEQVIVRMQNLIDNESFNNAGTVYPYSPLNWSGAVMDEKLSSNVAAGIISLKADSIMAKASDKDNPYKLPSNFAEVDASTLISPHDKNAEKANVLMISTLNQTAYAFKSMTYDIKPNSYYKLSVYVYTPDYSTIGEDYNYGAFVAVTGDITAISEPINTHNTWQEYCIYFSGYSYKTASIRVSLQLGDVSEDKDGNKTMRPASGYVFFDKVLLQPISYKTYQYYKNNPGQNEYFAEELSNNLLDDSFQGSFENGFSNWENIASTAKVSLESDVYIPFGNHALKIEASLPGYAGYRSQPIKIERHKFYHLAVWQNKTKIKNGTAFATIVSKDKNGEFKTHGTLNTFSQDLGSYSWLGDWKQGSFYIKGSSLMDKEVYLELWFGNSSSAATGTVYYDNITLEEILPEEFTNNSSNGTVVSLSDSQGAPGVDNGNFDNVGNYREYKYPMPAASWQALYEQGNEDLTIAGIIRGDKSHFEANKQNYGAPVYPYSDDQPNTNLLMITNTQPSAYGYAVDISVEAETYKKISVNLQTQIASGYGAELVLKQGDMVIARHSQIDTESQFRTYNFYVYSAYNSQTLTLEIWLGKKGGFDKEFYTSGHLFVDFVDAENVDADEFNNAKGLFNKKYSFLHEKFETFEQTDSLLKKPLNWTSINPYSYIKTVKAGVINLDEYDPSVLNIDKAVIGKDNLSPYALVIYSPEPTAYSMRQTQAISYETDSFYLITVRIKTVGIAKGLGARIILGDDYYFDNINTEYREFNVDNDFVDYKFYINVGSSTDTHIIQIWLGDNTKPDSLASGLIIVDQITIDKIDETAYNEGIADLAVEDEDLRPDNIIKVVMSETKDEDTKEEDKKAFPWWLWPTILFSVALVFCLILIAVVDLAPKFKSRSKKTKISYDRRLTINKNINQQAKEEKDEKTQTQAAETVERKPDVIITQSGKRLVRRKKYVPKEYKDEFED